MKQTDLVTGLVTGGTGLTGSRVARRLIDAGHSVRSGSRTAEPPFDWTRPETWPGALSASPGGRAQPEPPDVAYLCYPSDIGAPDAADRIRAFLAEARDHGLRRVVLLSARAQSSARPAEDAVGESGLAWTIVKSAWFAQNFTEGALSPWVQAGELPFPAGPANGLGAIGEPFVDADDLADVLAAALTDRRYEGQTLEITGPRLWTFGEAVAELAARTNRSLTYRPVSAEEFLPMLLDLGIPRNEAVALVDGFAETLDGRNAYTTDGVERVLGRPPRDFSQVVGSSGSG